MKNDKFSKMTKKEMARWEVLSERGWTPQQIMKIHAAPEYLPNLEQLIEERLRKDSA